LWAEEVGLCVFIGLYQKEKLSSKLYYIVELIEIFAVRSEAKIMDPLWDIN